LLVAGFSAVKELPLLVRCSCLPHMVAGRNACSASANTVKERGQSKNTVDSFNLHN
jgi:hypothetical protein